LIKNFIQLILYPIFFPEKPTPRKINFLFPSENPGEAAGCFDKALKIDSEDKDAWFYKGLCLSGVNNEEGAIECYNRALSLDPQCDYAWCGKGWSLYYQCEYDKALICFHKALEIDPNYSSAIEGKEKCQEATGR